MNEGDQTFTLTLSNFTGAIFETRRSTFTTTVKIIDDELPTVLISNPTLSVFEDVGNYVLGFKLSGTTTNDVTFDYALAGDSATEEVDYTVPAASERMVSIAGGESTDSVSIPITDDEIREGDETFTLTLSNLTGAVFANGAMQTETITILDNESINLSVTTTDFFVAEEVGTAGFVVNVGLSEATTLDVTFDYDLVDGTAEEGIDYVKDTNRTVTIEAGQTTGSFSIRILDDLIRERSQNFTLTLSNVKGAVFANGVGTITKTITIVDNESPIVFSNYYRF